MKHAIQQLSVNFFSTDISFTSEIHQKEVKTILNNAYIYIEIKYQTSLKDILTEPVIK